MRSGRAVAEGLRAAGYDVVDVVVKSRSIRALPRDVDAVFVALHGEFGEDGGVQKLLERKGLPYTGSDPAASRASFDKFTTKRLLAAAGVPTPPWEIVDDGRGCSLPLPVVVKPSCQGSSIGVNRVFRRRQWAKAAADARRYGRRVLVEAYIPGRELTVGIVGRQAMPVVEIVAPGGWYDYRAKYTAGQTTYICPAKIPAAVAARCRELALRTFRALGCRGLGRVDFRLSPDGGLYVLELNNIPGFTATSLLPKAALAAGIAFPDLCDRIVRDAWRAHVA